MSTDLRKTTNLKVNENSSNLSLDFLYEMAEGDKEFVIDILEIFTEDAPLTLDSIQESMKEGDLNAVKIAIHKLKSSIKILGLESLVSLAQNLEDEAGENNISSDFDLKVQKLDKSVQDLVKAASRQIKYLKQQL